MTFGDHGTPDGHDAQPGQPSPGQPPHQPHGQPGTPQGQPGAAPYGHRAEPVYGHRTEPAHDDQPAPAYDHRPTAPYGHQPAPPYGHQPTAPYGHQPTAPYGHQPAPTYGHPGAPYGGPEPQAARTAERERMRRGRGRRVAVAVTGGVLATAVVAGALLFTGGDDEDPAAASGPTPSTTSKPSGSPAVPRVDIGEPSNAPSALPSVLARPIIGPEQAFPKETVTLEDGSAYERVDMATTTDCERGMSAELAELIGQGEPCARMTAALFTDADRRSQVTVSVLSFRRPEDASRVFAMASLDPVTYQVVSLDPAPEAGLPTVPPGAPGLFERLMTVRSVVFANGQWGDGAETGEAELTRQTQGLLQYVNDDVLAYEQAGP
ncbi:hypothetical protein ABZZ79_13265 [Streptomyces sp. NPDC006458]|uniref:hypothetical protein n=1 Tax=Streptomyces sp. NPDC006458 TaxID=3154302 RepID=UPI0033AB654D